MSRRGGRGCCCPWISLANRMLQRWGAGLVFRTPGRAEGEYRGCPASLGDLEDARNPSPPPRPVHRRLFARGVTGGRASGMACFVRLVLVCSAVLCHIHIIRFLSWKCRYVCSVSGGASSRSIVAVPAVTTPGEASAAVRLFNPFGPVACSRPGVFCSNCAESGPSQQPGCGDKVLGGVPNAGRRPPSRAWVSGTNRGLFCLCCCLEVLGVDRVAAVRASACPEV